MSGPSETIEASKWLVSKYLLSRFLVNVVNHIRWWFTCQMHFSLALASVASIEAPDYL